MFQFQNGSIKSFNAEWSNDYFIKFQFQNGSIKRIERLSPLEGSALFQFQNGSIKRAVVNGGVIFRS